MSKSVVQETLPCVEPHTVEEALRVIPGVRSVRVIADIDSPIAEIHVVATPRRSPKKIVRDIETFLLVQYNHRIDYRCVSLVQVADNITTERVTLGRVEELRQPDACYIEVELLNGEQRYQGRCIVEGDTALAASNAAITALNALFAPYAPLSVNGVQCSTLGGRDVISAYIVYQQSTVEHMLGTTFVRGSVAEAAARAVLAATNRRLAGWIPNQQHALETALVHA
jgi:hypothetical protein